MKIAVSGKGGVGKTTIAAGLVSLLLSRGHNVFAVDADPDVSLGTLLGFTPDQIDQLKPIVEMQELIAKKVGGRGGLFTLNPDVDDIVTDYTLRQGQLQFLRMGAVKAGGSSCYCRESSVLNALIAVLLLQDNDFVVLDMSAGIEHLTRGTARGVDLMLIISDPSLVSVKTALVVERLSRELGIQKTMFIGNRIRRPREEDFLSEQLGRKNILGFLPFREEILEQSMEGDYAVNHYEIPGLATIVDKIAANSR
jgi:CO dehydrogenase maturation factor